MRVWILVAALGLAACKDSEFKSAALQLSWKPPRGLIVERESASGLDLSDGVTVRSVDGAPPAIDEAQLDALMLQALTAAKIEPLDRRISSRVGSIPAGPVARWVLAGGGQRALHYYLPLKGRFLLFSMTAPEAAFGTRESQFDLSLSSLKVE